MTWVNIAAFAVGEVVTSTKMNQVKDNAYAGPVATSISALNALFPGSAPADGARGVLKAAGPVENTYLPLIYSATLSKWVSQEFGGSGTQTFMSGIHDEGINSVGSNGTSQSPLIAFSWAPANAGMTLQVKGFGQIQGTGNAFTTFADVFLRLATSGSVTSTTVNIGSGLQNTTTQVRISWTNVTNPGAYEFAGLGIQARNDASNGNGSVYLGQVQGRWVG